MPRDAARLLVYHRPTGDVQFSRFTDLRQFLPAGAVLVLNTTKVVPARLLLMTEAGRPVEMLYLETRDGVVRALATRHLRPGGLLQHGTVALFRVRAHKQKWVDLEPLFPLPHLLAILQQYGTTPLPPYIIDSPLTEAERREQYQTVFAEHPGSVAAPTASLHFTPELLHDLTSHGITLQYVTLHVNLGTFAPLTHDHVVRGVLHEESYDISPDTADAIAVAKRAGRPIIGVGTTVVRALESAARVDGSLAVGAGMTDLFIQPGFQFQVIDGMVTNFHVPRSSLLMLVAALTGREKLLALYQHALAADFRFFSFGDGMLIT